MVDEVARARLVVLSDEDTGEVRHADNQLYTRINIIPPQREGEESERKGREEERERKGREEESGEEVIKISRLEAVTACPSDS